MSVLGHGRGVVGRDDDQVNSGAAQVTQRKLRGAGHRPGVERGDLILAQVGVDKKGGGEILGVDGDARGINPLVFEPALIIAKILACRAEQIGLRPEQAQAVGNVGGAASALAAHRVHQETHAQGVQLVRQDMIGKVAGEGHDVIIGQRSGNNDSHRSCNSSYALPPL